MEQAQTQIFKNENKGESQLSLEETRLPMQLVLAASLYAAQKHAEIGQKREDAAQTPYINHPLEVASLLADHVSVWQVDNLESHAAMLAAGVLHDVLEDVPTVSRAELEQLFGMQVANLVVHVSDDRVRFPSKVDRKRAQVEHISDPKTPVSAQFIKLADAVSNLRSLVREVPVGWSSYYLIHYALWKLLIARSAASAQVRQSWFVGEIELLCKNLVPDLWVQLENQFGPPQPEFRLNLRVDIAKQQLELLRAAAERFYEHISQNKH
jgi:guanosine-3',5'-bis(diphosphate) 3'-pyrophosphohydrolase